MPEPTTADIEAALAHELIQDEPDAEKIADLDARLRALPADEPDPPPPPAATAAGVEAPPDTRDIDEAMTAAIKAGDLRAVNASGMTQQFVDSRLLAGVLTAPSGVMSQVVNLGRVSGGVAGVTSVTTDVGAASGQSETATSDSDAVTARVALTPNSIRSSVKLRKRDVATSLNLERDVTRLMQAQIQRSYEALLVTGLTAAAAANTNAGRQQVAQSGQVAWTDIANARARLNVTRRPGAIILAGSALESGLFAAIIDEQNNSRDGRPVFTPTALDGLGRMVGGMPLFVSDASGVSGSLGTNNQITGFIFSPRDVYTCLYLDEISVDGNSEPMARSGQVSIVADLTVGLAVTPVSASICASIVGKA